MKPIIGITTSAMTSPRNGREFGRFFLERDYVDRVIVAGGAPIMIPPGADAETIGPILDGLIIPGGNDIDSQFWGEDTHPEVELEYSLRTQTEAAVYENLRPEAPVLGICYGCQLVNVLEGGSLTQHLPDVLGHDGHRGDPIQEYRIELETRLASILGTKARGKSWHHQAVNRLADGMKISAWHEDGTIEAIESTAGRWFLGLQWHPERTDVEESVILFEAFLAAVKQAKEVRA